MVDDTTRRDEARKVARCARDRFAEASGLYLIVTRPLIPHLELVTAAVDRGVPVIQLREKSLDDEALMKLASSLVEATRGSGTLMVVNDRPDIAVRVGADGAHVGTGDLAAGEARRILGPRALLGVSGNAPEEARAALSAGADYVGVGPVFPTETKPDACTPVGVSTIRRMASAVPDLPIVAVGGINIATASRVTEAGARYVAVVSAVCRAPDPVAAIDALMSELDRKSEWAGNTT